MLVLLVIASLLVIIAKGDPVRIDTLTKVSYIHVESHNVSIEGLSNVTFTIMTANDAHVALSQYPDDLHIYTYELVIGGWKNKKSVIRPCVSCKPKVFWDHHPLDSSEYRPFWISWTDGILRCGSGSDVGESEFLQWHDPDAHDISYMAVSTGWGSNGSWGFNYVDGNWSEWTEWTHCSVSCGGGLHNRSRVCDNPEPVYGIPCDGPDNEESSCQTLPCIVKGKWAEWGTWAECSTSCDQGLTSRRRLCVSVVPGLDFLPCVGDATETKLCIEGLCPVNGNWSSWSEWTVCSLTCGTGLQERTRTCTDPVPQHEGLPCEGTWHHQQLCNVTICPVAGFWSTWSEWSPCSQSCDRGSRSRKRICNKAHFSYDCAGNDTHTIDCNFMDCLDEPEDRISVVEYHPVEAPGAVGLGILGMVMIGVFLVLVAILDLMTLPRHIQILKRNLSHVCPCVHAPSAKTGRRGSRYRRHSNDSDDGSAAFGCHDNIGCHDNVDETVPPNNAVVASTRRRRYSNGEIDLRVQYENNWAGGRERETGRDVATHARKAVVTKETWGECVSKHNSTLYIRNDTSHIQMAQWDLVYMNALREVRPQLSSTRL